jgi:hypothetical protein
VRLVTDWKISGRHSVSIAYAPRGERHYFKELSMSEYIPQDKQDDTPDVEGQVKPEGEGRYINEMPDSEGRYINRTDDDDDGTPDVEGHRMHRP